MFGRFPKLTHEKIYYVDMNKTQILVIIVLNIFSSLSYCQENRSKIILKKDNKYFFNDQLYTGQEYSYYHNNQIKSIKHIKDGMINGKVTIFWLDSSFDMKKYRDTAILNNFSNNLKNVIKDLEYLIQDTTKLFMEEREYLNGEIGGIEKLNKLKYKNNKGELTKKKNEQLEYFLQIGIKKNNAIQNLVNTKNNISELEQKIEIESLKEVHNPFKMVEFDQLDSKKEGMSITYNSIGQKTSAGVFSENLKHKKWEFYGPNSKLIEEIEFDLGKIIKRRILHLNGKTKYEINLKDNILDGEFKEYLSNGSIKITGNYINGIRNGSFIEFDSLGYKINETTYFMDGATRKVNSTYFNQNSSVKKFEYQIDESHLYDPRNSKKYKTVRIGTQTWTAENLNTIYFRNGDEIFEAKNIEDWEISVLNKTPAWCYIDFDFKNDKKYGKLYNIYAINDPRGITPVGWSIPNSSQWKTLSLFLGGRFQDYKKLKMSPIIDTIITFKEIGGYEEEKWISCNECSYWTEEQKIKSPCFSCQNKRGKYEKTGVYIPKINEKIQNTVNIGWDGNNSSGFSAFPTVSVNRDAFFYKNEAASWWIRHDVNQVCNELFEHTQSYSPIVGNASLRADKLIINDPATWDSFYGLSIRCIEGEPADDIGSSQVLNYNYLDSEETNFVKIGSQIWMNQNLNVMNFRNGQKLYYASNEKDWIHAFLNKQPAFCFYNFDPTLGDNYGLLYNYYALSDPRGLAPIGWHIPDDNEWTQLSCVVGDHAGKKIKSISGWGNLEQSNIFCQECSNWTKKELKEKLCKTCKNMTYQGIINKSMNGFDIFNLNILPAGCYFTMLDVPQKKLNEELTFYSKFSEKGRTSVFWSKSENSGIVIGDAIGFGYYAKPCGLSVRCIKD